MTQNDIDGVLDQLRRMKKSGSADLNSFKIDKIEMHLRFLKTFIMYHLLLPNFLVKITEKAKCTVKMLHIVFSGIPDECGSNFNSERLESELLESILRYNYDQLNDSYLEEYMDCLGKNLNDVLIMCLEGNTSYHSLKNEEILLFIKQLKIVQKKMKFLRYVYVSEINGCVEHEKLKGLETRIQFMADNVGQICFSFWVCGNEEEIDSAKETDAKEDEEETDSEKETDSEETFYEETFYEEDEKEEDEEETDSEETDSEKETDSKETFYEEDEKEKDSEEDEEETDSEETDSEETDSEETDSKETDSKEDENDISRKPRYLLFLVVLVELEMQKIFLGELKASKFTQSRTFKDKILPKGFSHHLRNLLVYLRNEKLKKFPTNNVTARNIDVAIEFLLVFLGDVPNHVINGKGLNEVLANIGVLVGDILCVIQMLLAESTIKEDSSKIDFDTIQILEKIEDLKAQVEERYKSLKYSPSNEFPTVGGLSFLDSLLRKLNEMLKSESSLDFLMKPHIGILEKELSSLTSVFRDIAKVQHKHDEILKDLQRRAVNLAYEAEVSIDSILVKYNALWHSFCSLPAIIEEINHINVEVTKMGSVNLALTPFFVVEPSKHLPPQDSNLMNDEDDIVGFEDDTKIIIQHLIRGTSELDVIPIVGMGGKGKTTCAKKLYNNDIIVSHFDVRAWCIISQTYNRIELLQDIFSQVTGSKGEKDDVLAEMLKKKLTVKRYLIVLDDMWDGMAWDDLRLCFPDVGNRSRIVLTTRLEKVAEQAKHHTDPYYLPFLKPDESLKLLQKKVFQQEGCPPELQDVSQAVAERCKGLPLVIILVAGIIKRKKMEVSWWNEVKNSLLSYLGESEGYCLSTMQLSYNNLPDYLKPCLLYMGMFPEDARIPVSKLISLWIAEDFVQNIESIEEAAEGYLTELISSNVVMVSKREYNDKVKYCQVHDVVLHFCLEKSRNEKFMLTVKGQDSQFQPCYWKESRVRFSFSEELSKESRKPFHQHLRSLITTNQAESYHWNPIRQVSEVRLLKVLDLSCCGVRALWSVTLKPLIHLKYLAVRAGKFHFHPESHLLHLETLIVMGISIAKSKVLPASFWKMGKLRHVDVSGAEFDKQGIFEQSLKLVNLRKLRRVVIFNADRVRVDVLLGKCPNLQELDMSIYGSPRICLKWECLTQLQILCLSFSSPVVLSGLQLLSSLKKLVLRMIPLQITIPFIAGLPSLEYLHIKNPDLIESKEWCLGDVTFHNLNLLKLSYFGISRWDASEESFPQLKTLVIKRCDDLEEIPLSFADISTLEQIKLIKCENESLKASAAKMKEDVEENEGNDRIDLIIKDFESWPLTYQSARH